MSLPHETRVAARYHFGVRLDEKCAGWDLASPVGLAR